jgi:hypothetical protein
VELIEQAGLLQILPPGVPSSPDRVDEIPVLVIRDGAPAAGDERQPLLPVRPAVAVLAVEGDVTRAAQRHPVGDVESHRRVVVPVLNVVGHQVPAPGVAARLARSRVTVKHPLAPRVRFGQERSMTR